MLLIAVIAPVLGTVLLTAANAVLLYRGLSKVPEWSGGWYDSELDRHWCEREQGAIRSVWVYRDVPFDVVGTSVLMPTPQAAATRKRFIQEPRRVRGWMSHYPRSRAVDEAVFVELGWPIPLLQGWTDLSYGATVHHSVIEIAVQQSNVMVPTRLRVLHLLGIAYAIGAVPVVVLLCLQGIRAGLRRKRGLCRRCAYPVGIHTQCTECGLGISE
jgi:hypothetical protein